MNRSVPKPDNEIERLVALDRLSNLEHIEDSDFNKIVERAKGFFNVPIALISLVDRDRQWFKAKCGVDLHQTSRDIAFCAYAILSSDVMVVLDALKDARFQKNPLVVGDPHIRFYAGAPIIVPDGLVLGTLCIIDKSPRDSFSKYETVELAKLAGMASALIQKKAGL